MKIFKIFVIVLFLLSCEKEVGFWENCERLDQGLVMVENASKLDIYTDVRWDDLKENNPILLPAIDGVFVQTQFQRIPVGEAKIWFSLYEDFADVKVKRVNVNPCETTYCTITIEDLTE